MRGRRLSISVGCSHRENSAGTGRTTDLLFDYSEKILANGYRAYLRGDKLEGRVDHFMEQTKCRKVIQTRSSRPMAVSRLRSMEGRFAWVLSLRENVTHYVLRACRITHYNRLRDHRIHLNRPQS